MYDATQTPIWGTINPPSGLTLRVTYAVPRRGHTAMRYTRRTFMSAWATLTMQPRNCTSGDPPVDAYVPGALSTSGAVR